MARIAPQQCKGTARSTGERCRSYAAVGAVMCQFHGGTSPAILLNAKRRIQQAEAEAQFRKNADDYMRVFGRRKQIHPAEALVELVQWTATEVEYWREKVNSLKEDELTWNLTHHQKGRGPQGPVDVKHYDAVMNIAYRMLRESSDRLASYSAAALKAGVDERRVALAENQGMIVVTALGRILDGMFNFATAAGLSPASRSRWDEVVSELVPRELRAAQDPGLVVA